MPELLLPAQGHVLAAVHFIYITDALRNKLL